MTSVSVIDRSEIAEVGTAVSDGCDAILLGAETARGRHPVSSVSELLHICREAERSFDRSAHFAKMQVRQMSPLHLCPRREQSQTSVCSMNTGDWALLVEMFAGLLLWLEGFTAKLLVK